MSKESFENKISLLFLCFEQNSNRNLYSIFKNYSDDSTFFSGEDLNNQQLLLDSHFYYGYLTNISKNYINSSVFYFNK